ncbi:hypothetical protein NPIL_514751 [Nephila pilipes]|uniref:Uncharacterized protein n=1 Tax=Nephila pilipes TaxID=299642 RepID=A0A8X6PWU1_NEPPI|nr:hypothetical protein NPIL_514751 [Nephila pilipes]
MPDFPSTAFKRTEYQSVRPPHYCPSLLFGIFLYHQSLSLFTDLAGTLPKPSVINTFRALLIDSERVIFPATDFSRLFWSHLKRNETDVRMRDSVYLSLT